MNTLERVQDEQITCLSNERFKIIASNRGAILKSISIDNQLITRDIPQGETKPGEKGAFFCAPIVFGRIINRKLPFLGSRFNMPYPDDIDAEEVDPQKIYIHGIHHYYTYDIESCTDSKVSYVLNKNRLPRSYPFPHSCRVEYSLEDNDLLISLSVFDTKEETPAMLTLHPFFRYSLSEENKNTLQFKGRLQSRFDYDTSSDLPMPWDPPTPLQNGGPFTEWTSLDTTLDHSFISEDGIIEIRWENGPHLTMIDESPLPDENQRLFPLQIWTSGGHTRNACGIEQGGPANLFELVDKNIVPPSYLTRVHAGQIKTRQVRYKVSP